MLITEVFYKLRHTTSKLSYISNFGGYKIQRVKDLSLGYDSAKHSIPEDKLVSPSSEILTFELDESTVMTLRGSGTEPKLKYYIESKGQSMAESQSKAIGVEKALLELFHEFGLKV